MFVFATADVKSLSKPKLTVEILKAPSVSVHPAASERFFNSPAPRTQEAKRAKISFLFNVSFIFHLNFSVASATTANNTHKM